MLARVLLAQDRPGLALALLDRPHAPALAEERTGSVIEIGALRALALAAGGDEAAAVTALAGRLLLACPEGYFAIFRRRGPADGRAARPLVAAQRTGQAAAGVPLGYLAWLRRPSAPRLPRQDQAGAPPPCRASSTR